MSEFALFGEVDPALAATIAAIFVFGGVVKGATGFGLPLITISLTPLVAPLDLALALNTLVVPITNIAQFWAAGGHGAALRLCWPLIIGLCLTTFAAAHALSGLAPSQLSAAMGALLIGFAVLSFAAPRLRIPAGAARPAAFGAGLAGGVVGAVITAPGPIFAVLFVGLGLDRRAMVAAMGLSMIAVGLVVSSAFAAVGVLDAGRAMMSAAAAIPAFAGMWLGDRLGRRLSVEAFRRMVLIMLFGLGLHHLARAFG